ncbi:hypothetical protein FQA47_022041, partial [Oryzias melastigma]
MVCPCINVYGRMQEHRQPEDTDAKSGENLSFKSQAGKVQCLWAGLPIHLRLQPQNYVKNLLEARQ